MFVDWLLVALISALTGLLAVFAIGFTLKKAGRVALMDVMWGPLVFVLSLAAALAGTALGTAGVLPWILLGLIAIWAARLARHLASRFGSDVEDPRYEELMSRPAAGLVRSVLLPQGIVAWLISLPVQAAAVAGDPLWPVVIAGGLLALAGLIFETVADRQLENFRQERTGGIMDQGLWSWSRHPNYFGESVIWWGIWLVAAAAWPGILTILSPALMTWVLINATGVKTMERHMADREGWSEYTERTSIFIPLPPSR